LSWQTSHHVLSKNAPHNLYNVRMQNAQNVIAAVIKHNDKLLVCKRPEHKRHGGLWEFPGGKLENAESFFEAAQRELAEELALSVIHIGDVAFATTDEASGFKINFVEVQVEGQPTLLEHSALDWLSPAELLNIELAPSDRRYAEFLNNKSAI
jgi:8-oxo-dGTP diphosphatase